MLQRVLLISFCLIIAIHADAQSNYKKVTIRYKQWLLDHNHTPGDSIFAWVNSINAEGKWPDIDYANRFSGSWETAIHLARIRSMACTWATRGHKYYQGNEIWKKISLGVDHWLKMRYINSNWWYQEIGIPQYWRDILTLTESHLSPSQIEGALSLLKKYDVKPNFTGANLAWSADLMLHDGLFTQDEEKIKKAVALLTKEIAIGKTEGIQPDYSFYQHGYRLQTHSYGASYLRENIRLGWELQQSPWPFPQTKTDLLADFIIEGWQWMARGINNSPGTIDRAISRAGNLQKADLRDYLPYLISISTKKKELERVMQVQKGSTQSPVGFRYFPYADFAAYQQKGFSFFVKTISSRTAVTESINGENSKGAFLNFGDSYLIRTGNEYTDLMPVWDWKKLPGQTIFANATGIEKLPYNGGVFCNEYGASASDLRSTGDGDTLNAFKFWACYQNTMVCLIAGLSLNSNHEAIYTTLDQSRWKEDVVLNRPGNVLKQGLHHFDNVKWVYHAGFVYVPQNGAEMKILTDSVSGSWNTINKSGSKLKITERVFMPVMYHADHTSEAYSVSLANNVTEAKKVAESPNYIIISNTPNCQAVVFNKRTIMAAFRDSAVLQYANDLQVSVNKPCMLLITNNQLYVSDPLHTGADISVTVNERNFSIKMPADGSTTLVTNKIN